MSDTRGGRDTRQCLCCAEARYAGTWPSSVCFYLFEATAPAKSYPGSPTGLPTLSVGHSGRTRHAPTGWRDASRRAAIRAMIPWAQPRARLIPARDDDLDDCTQVLCKFQSLAAVFRVAWARRAQILNCTAKKTGDDFFETYRACVLTLHNAPEWPLLCPAVRPMSLYIVPSLIY